MVKSENVLEIIYSFVQNSFSKSFLPQVVKTNLIENLFSKLGSIKNLHSDDILTKFNIDEQTLLYELLMQYIMFFTHFDELTFPDNFLDNSSSFELGEPLLAYIVEHQFPFPQQLPQ